MSFKTNPGESAPDPKDFHRQIRIVFVVGKPPLDSSGDPSTETELRDIFRGIQGRVVYYDQMVEYARNAYSEYLKKRGTISRIDQILDGL